MKLFELSNAVGALVIVFAGCSSSDHLLGENSGGTSGKGNAAGEHSSAGLPGSAGEDNSNTAGTGGAGSDAGASDTGGSTTGGSGAGGAGRAGSGAGGSGTAGTAAGGTAGTGAGGSGGMSVGGSGGSGGNIVELTCQHSGGVVTTQLCCGNSQDFPPTCAVGACSCAPASSHEVKSCTCPSGLCFDGQRCIASGG